jgi:hypothetical protein
MGIKENGSSPMICIPCLDDCYLLHGAFKRVSGKKDWILPPSNFWNRGAFIGRFGLLGGGRHQGGNKICTHTL